MRKDPTNNKDQLGQILERYKRILRPPQASVEKEALRVIAEVTNIILVEGQVSYTPATRTLIIKAPSVLRSELMRHKTSILRELKSALGATHSPTELI